MARRRIRPKIARPRGIPRPKPLRPRGIRRKRYGITFAEYLESLSEFGGTRLERLVDGAARELNIFFDASQYSVWLAAGKLLTRIDRVIFNPLTAIYIDGIQHELRPQTAQSDAYIRQQLRSMGWRVVVLGWRGLVTDPLNEVRKVLYAG